MKRKTRPLGRAVAAGAVASLALTGCQGPAGSARIFSADASGDGTLRVGLILDNTGPQNLATSARAWAAVSVRRCLC